MTTHVDGKGITWECDGCDELWVWEHPGEFKKGWQAAAREAWRATKDGRGWLHWCPKCGRRDTPARKNQKKRVIVVPD